MRQRAQLSAVFALMGAASASLPATIPMRAHQLGIELGRLMPGIPALFLGLFLGIAMTPIISRSMTTTNHVRFGIALQSIGVLGIGFLNSQQLFILSSLVIGLGFGQLEVLITSIARVESENVGNLLTRLGIYLAASAFLTPIAIIASDLLGASIVINILIALISLYLFFAFRTEHIHPHGKSFLVIKIANKKVYLLILATTFYVGAETILAGWSAVLFSENISQNLTSAPLGTSIFWVGMTLGRVVGTIASSKKLSARSASIIWSLSLSFALIVLSQISETAPRATFLLILVIAIFFAGPCYGFIIGQAVSQYEESLAVKSSTLFVLIGSLGGVLIPTLSQIALGSQSKDVLLGAAVAAALSTAFLTMSFREKESTYHQS
jgi:FHS family glucose/mannose:H+ symporter-like MFS transporter